MRRRLLLGAFLAIPTLPAAAHHREALPTPSAQRPKRVAAPTAADLAALAWTIWGEARGEGRPGQLAVAHTVLNRVARTDEAFRHDVSIRAACHRRGQYTCWAAQRMPGGPPPPEMLRAAHEALGGSDLTRGSTHYHVVGLRERWTAGMTPTVRIGDHQFYRAPLRI